MNAEELKMVLDAIATLGVNGKEAFIWWLVLKYGSSLITSVMFLIGALCVPYLVLRTIRQLSRSNTALKEIAKNLGVDFWDWADDDVSGHGTRDVVREFLESRK